MITGNLENIFSLDGKTALVTGGGQGLGGAIAEGFAQFGADVSVVDINPSPFHLHLHVSAVPTPSRCDSLPATCPPVPTCLELSQVVSTCPAPHPPTA